MRLLGWVCSGVTQRAGCGSQDGVQSGPNFRGWTSRGGGMNRLLSPAWMPPHPPAPPLLAATRGQGIDLALCVVVPVSRSRPHLFGEEKGGSVVPNRGGIHGQAWGAG